MKFSRRLAVAALTVGLMPTTLAAGHAVTRHHAVQYRHAYRAVAHKFGARTPGRNILRWGLRSHKRLSDERLVASLVVLHRMLAPPPPPPPAPTYTPAPSSTYSAPSSPAPAPAATTPPPGLASCIIQHESGGNPQATNGPYGGIGQWSPAAWAQDGGTKYASSPTGASYAQQAAVLNGEGTATMQQQQGQYDGCSG